MADNSFTHLVVVGPSAGGIGALSGLVFSLPADFDVPIVVAQHLDPNRESHLQDILARRSPLAVKTVTEHEPLQPGVVYVVPANKHLILREAIRNAVRHSGCRRLTVGLDITSEEVSGYVEDDGCGFEGNGGTRDGLGLHSRRERAALLQGTVEVYSSQKGGVGVQIRIPLRNGGE